MPTYTTAQVRAALLATISKWDEIAAGRWVDDGFDNCELCKLFNKNPKRDKCVGCPVAIYSNNWLCINTPHDAWNRYHSEGLHYLSRQVHTEGDHQLALNFANYLREVEQHFFNQNLDFTLKGQ